MSASKKEGKRGAYLLRLESGPTLSNYRQDSTAQTSGDLRLAPVFTGQGSGISSEAPSRYGGLCPSQPTGSAYSAASATSTRGWPSVLLALRCCILPKLALLPVKPKSLRDRPGVRMEGDVTPNGRGLDH